MKPNFLFIMADQLRADYLGCAGHPSIQTPHLDRLAEEGVRFTSAFCQSPVCGPSRMSFYTGRYMINHGSTYNNVPLRLCEPTLGDHLRALGYRVALVGKTHMKADYEGMKRLGIDPGSSLGVLVAQCGFEPYERDDGLHPDQAVDPDLAYNRYLRAHGFDGENPWHEWANSAVDENGTIVSGWYMRNAHLPARIPEEHSETAYMTRRAMQFIRDAGRDQPWCLHLSYIKPHWPYMAPAPYHELYTANDLIPPNRSAAERQPGHPVVEAFRRHEESVNFARDEVRSRVLPTYMGLATQIDDHLGRLFAFLEEQGLADNTVVVFTSDHGDFLGDHWLGEKEIMYEEALRIPMIVRLPGGVRGLVSDALVESIDLAATFVELAGGTDVEHVLEGRSLVPWLRGETPSAWRDAVFSEMDYAWRPARTSLGVAPDAARAFMVRTARWKYIRYTGFPPQLFDLENDPAEQRDLGRDPGYAAVRAEMDERLLEWLTQRRTRITMSNATVAKLTGTARRRGYIYGAW
ncbi:MAG TPA: alkaline phosphatase family protein [Burkholderiales bacterium]